MVMLIEDIFPVSNKKGVEISTPQPFN